VSLRSLRIIEANKATNRHIVEEMSWVVQLSVQSVLKLLPEHEVGIANTQKAEADHGQDQDQKADILL
jgi:hypothetical protein